MSDMPAAFKSVTRTARKQHRCCECLTPIMPGTKYKYSSGVWDGQASSYKQCEDCAFIMNAAASEAGYSDEGPSFRDLRNYFFDQMHVGFVGEPFVLERAKDMGCDPAALARLLSIELTA